MTIAKHQRPLLGFKGELGSGKSTVAEALRQCAGSHYDRGSNLEFSDPIIEAANLALATDIRLVENFRCELRLAAQHVLGLVNGEVRALDILSASSGCISRDQIMRAEQGLRDWLSSASPGLQVNSHNKDQHRPVLIWLGVMMWELVAQDVWAQEVARRIRWAWPSCLVTVGGVRASWDAITIRREGGLVVEVVGRTSNQDNDATNARRDEIVADVVFYNDVFDPTLDRVRETAAELWEDMRADRLQEVYRVRR